MKVNESDSFSKVSLTENENLENLDGILKKNEFNSEKEKNLGKKNNSNGKKKKKQFANSVDKHKQYLLYIKIKNTIIEILISLINLIILLYIINLIDYYKKIIYNLNFIKN